MQEGGGRTGLVVAMPQARRSYPEPTEFYVYVLVCGEFSKIGKTTNPEQRFNQIEPRLPWPVKEFILLPCVDRAEMNWAERFLHNYFADKRGHGEWFNLADQDIEELRGRAVKGDEGE